LLQDVYNVECNSEQQAAVLVTLLGIVNINARQHNSYGFTA
jgi:hypothetical protein